MATTAQIYIDGEILPETYIWEGDQATSLYRVRQQIEAAGTFDRIRLNIFSPGGYCLEGWAIVDYLLSLGFPIDTLAYGQCASFGTVFHTMGEVREISQHCDYVLHRPWDFFMGNDLQNDDFNIMLKKETRKLFEHYATPTGNTIDELSALIQKDDLKLSPQETVDHGFSTAIFNPGPSASAKMKALNIRKPTYLLSLKDRKPNPNAPKDSQTIYQKTMDEKKKSLWEAAKSALAFLSGTEVKALDVKLKDGRTLVTNSTGDTPVVGDTAQIDDKPAPDGDYILANDVTLTVKDGVITAVNDPNADSSASSADPSASVEDKPEDLPTIVAALRKENGELKAKQSTTETRMSQLETRMSAILGAMVSQEVPTQGNRIVGTGSAKATLSDEDKERQEMLNKHLEGFGLKPTGAK